MNHQHRRLLQNDVGNDGTSPQWDFVHPTIAHILKCPKRERTTSFLRKDDDDDDCLNGGLVLDFPSSATLDDLVDLAWECDCKVDEWIYSPDVQLSFEIEKQMKGQEERYWNALFEFTSENHPNVDDSSTNVMVATLLALNRLESAIRHATGYVTGKAPLLKTMIQELDQHSSSLHHACSLLLTPSKGLNLRNLLWHGFVAELPRPWLSLVIVLTRLLLLGSSYTPDKKKVNGSKEERTPCVMDCRSVPALCRLLEEASTLSDDHREFNLLSDPPTLLRPDDQPWLPPSHQNLYETVLVPWLKHHQRPATCCALLSILIEHGLRLDWCHANHRYDDIMARPNRFYVTLDGHGQRSIHDLLLHPFVTTTTINVNNDDDDQQQHQCHKKNALIVSEELPPSTLAFLTDLFCSSCGGPNIRATVSHGLWDTILQEEWTRTDDTNVSPSHINTSQQRLWHLVELLLMAMNLIATQRPILYRPIFSYTAVTRRALIDSHMVLQRLQRERHDPTDTSLPTELLTLQPDYAMLQIQERLLTDASDTIWTVNDIYHEHEWNMILADEGLTRSLLQDISKASQQLLHDVEEAQANLESQPDAHKRKVKSWLRMVAYSRQLGLALYTLAFNVAVLNLISKEDHLDVMAQALRRTRMIVSTTHNDLREKVDKTAKSIVEFSNGKAIRQVAERIQEEKERQDKR